MKIIPLKQILLIAQNQIKNLNQNNPYYKEMIWIETEPVAIPNGYFFDYSYELVNPNEVISFGGATGFTINANTGELKEVSWEEYKSLNFYK